MSSVIAFLILTFAVFGFSQTVDTTSKSRSVQGGIVIDGSINPEKIRDVDAHRLFLATVAEPANASREQKGRQRAFLKHIALGSADLASVIRTLAAFSKRYDALIQNYNAYATAAAMNDTEVDIKSFLADRDLLVESTRSELQATLTPEGMMAWDSFVQSERKTCKLQWRISSETSKSCSSLSFALRTYVFYSCCARSRVRSDVAVAF